jgi:hypothetical protein
MGRETKKYVPYSKYKYMRPNNYTSLRPSCPSSINYGQPKSRIRMRLGIQTHLYFPQCERRGQPARPENPPKPRVRSELSAPASRKSGRNERWWTMPNTASRSGLILSVLSIVQGRCILLTIPSHSTIELRSWRKLPNLYFQHSIHPSTLTHRSPAHMSRNHHIERLTAITHT